MERSEKIKETQYLWRFEKEGMLQADKERYGPLIEVMDPLFESGITLLTGLRIPEFIASATIAHALGSFIDGQYIPS